MRCVGFVLVFALAAPVAAAPRRPAPLPLPGLTTDTRHRQGASPMVVVIGPSSPLRKQPALDEQQREALQRKTSTTAGLERIAAIDALTAALEQLDPPDETFELVMAEIASLYARALFEPTLETYPFADELIVRAAKSIAVSAETTAKRALQRMLVKFPQSPFLYDAYLTLAGFAESRNDHATAERHLEKIIATYPGDFARYARLRLGWVLHAAKDYKRAVAEFSTLMISSEPLIAGAAAESIVIAYAEAGRADHAAALFDHVDRSQSAERLRRLASEYGDRKKHAEEAIVLRAAIAREPDANVRCLDRADLVSALITTTRRADAEIAIAELADAVRFADSKCANEADIAVGSLAYTWHAMLDKKLDYARAIRAWIRAGEFATTPERREAAMINRDALAGAQRAAR